MMLIDKHCSDDGKECVVRFWCPGCQKSHVYRISGNGPVWDFNGDSVAPTFSPSLLNTWVYGDNIMQRCHLFVTGGRIQYLDDCTHSLRGWHDMVDLETV